MQNIISIRDFSRRDLDTLIEEALAIKANGVQQSLSDKMLASLFFEDSTRTRISTETAAHNLGMYVNGFPSPEGTSIKKGEPLLDTVRMFEGWGYDTIFMRHNIEGAARFAADNLSTPVVNCGDGAGSHPTQTMLDLMTLKETLGSIDDLTIALVGDLMYGRTVHSLLQACELYDVNVWLVAPEMLAMPQWRINDYKKKTRRDVTVTADLMEAIRNVNILYITRIQKERFPKTPEGEMEYERVSSIYNLEAGMLTDANDFMIVLHPLPRYKYNMEIAIDVDRTKHACYIDPQAVNGVPMRTAIEIRVLGKGFEGRKKKKKRGESLWRDLEITHGTKKGKSLLYRVDNGTLIDHVERGRGYPVFQTLGLDGGVDYIIAGVKSKRYGKKEVVGIKDIELTEKQLSKLALISSRAKVNIIKGGRVVKKGKVMLPYVLDDFLECQTRLCVSRAENFEFAPSKFYVERRGNPLIVRCHYCETPLKRQEIKLL